MTGLRGCFLYTLKADPRNELVELSETNNAGSVVVRLPWKGPGRRGCPRAAEDPGNRPMPLRRPRGRPPPMTRRRAPRPPLENPFDY